MVNKNFTLLSNICREITQEFMETEEGYVTVVLYTLCVVILRKLSSIYRQVWSRDWYQLRTCVIATLVPITDMCGREIGTNYRRMVAGLVPFTDVCGGEIGTNYRHVWSRDWYQLQTCLVAGLVPFTDVCGRGISTNYTHVYSRDWCQLQTCLVARLVPITDVRGCETGTNSATRHVCIWYLICRIAPTIHFCRSWIVNKSN